MRLTAVGSEGLDVRIGGVLPVRYVQSFFLGRGGMAFYILSRH